MLRSSTNQLWPNVIRVELTQIEWLPGATYR